MSWAVVREALKTRLSAITGIGVVHGRIRGIDETNIALSFKALFHTVSPAQLHTWLITRTNVPMPVLADGTDSTYVITHNVQIEGYMAFQDDKSGNSEDRFQAIIDLVAADFRTGDRRLGNTSATGVQSYSLPEEGNPVDHAPWGETHCHTCLLRFQVEEIV